MGHDDSNDTPLEEVEAKNEGSLWERAYARLLKEKPEVVEEYEIILGQTTDVNGDLPLNERMTTVVDNRLGVLTSRQWKIRIPFRKDSKIPVTVLVEKIVGVVLKFKSFGATLANLDPVHAGIPFAAVCLLLPVSSLAISFSSLKCGR
jgi:hypothetical protein